MKRLGHFGWVVLALAVPGDRRCLQHAERARAPWAPPSSIARPSCPATAPASTCPLPHVVNPGAGKPTVVRYVIDIDLPAASLSDANSPDALSADDGPYLLIPPAQSARIAGDRRRDLLRQQLLPRYGAGPTVSTTVLVRLPRRGLAPGRNRLTITVEAGRFISPVYLSRLYLGTDAQLSPSFKWRTSSNR